MFNKIMEIFTICAFAIALTALTITLVFVTLNMFEII